MQVQVLKEFTLRRTGGGSVSFQPGIQDISESDLQYTWVKQHVILVPPSLTITPTPAPLTPVELEEELKEEQVVKQKRKVTA